MSNNNDGVNNLLLWLPASDLIRTKTAIKHRCETLYYYLEFVHTPGYPFWRNLFIIIVII